MSQSKSDLYALTNKGMMYSVENGSPLKNFE